MHLKLGLIGVSGVIAVAFFAAGHASTDYVDQRNRSKNFNGKTFEHPRTAKKGFWDIVSMRVNSNWAEWPDFVPVKTDPSPEVNVEDKKARVTLVNHSTFLIQTHGYNILTDPIYSERCSPVSFAGPKRVHRPGIDFDKLPRIDVVIISHDHYDHLDIATIDRLMKRDAPKIFMGLGVAERLDSIQNTQELDWWEESQIASNFKLTFVPVQHFSGRTLFDHFSTLWGGYVLEIEDKKIYFGGDSGYADHYKKTFAKFGAMDLALLPIGAYAPRDFMSYAHMNPAEAVKAHIDLQSKQSIGMHYGTFQLTAEEIDEPKAFLQAAIEENSLSNEDFVTLPVGEPREFWAPEPRRKLAQE